MWSAICCWLALCLYRRPHVVLLVLIEAVKQLSILHILIQLGVRGLLAHLCFLSLIFGLLLSLFQELVSQTLVEFFLVVLVSLLLGDRLFFLLGILFSLADLGQVLVICPGQLPHLFLADESFLSGGEALQELDWKPLSSGGVSSEIRCGILAEARLPQRRVVLALLIRLSTSGIKFCFVECADVLLQRALAHQVHATGHGRQR